MTRIFSAAPRPPHPAPHRRRLLHPQSGGVDLSRLRLGRCQEAAALSRSHRRRTGAVSSNNRSKPWTGKSTVASSIYPGGAQKGKKLLQEIETLKNDLSKSWQSDR